MLSDDIREFVFREYIEPARLRGERKVTIRAGDVHDRMGLVSRMPAVCGAIGADKFQDEYRVRLVNRTGPNNGANAFFTFLLSPQGPREAPSIEAHGGRLDLSHSFDDAWAFLYRRGPMNLSTSRGAAFQATAGHAREGRSVIRFLQDGRESGRAYKCCWGRYYNCNRTRIGMYCRALDEAIID